jgi:single cache domain-containing protein
MFRALLMSAVSATALTFSVSAFAQAQSGTAAEAKAMLDKAVVAVKADKPKALEMFLKGEGGFKDRDLYPFCFNIADGITVAAPPTVLGKDVRSLKDPTGKGFGAEIYSAAKDGPYTEVSYNFPRPGDTAPVPKVSFVTKVGDLGCGVGYYK